MSTSNPKRKLTKAGVALSAEARSRLQQLADWMERELKGNQNPQVRLEYSGGVLTNTHTNVTSVSPIGALVQMFQPFELKDAKQILPGLYLASGTQLSVRFANILGVTHSEYLELIRYLYSSTSIAFAEITKLLRTLK